MRYLILALSLSAAAQTPQKYTPEDFGGKLSAPVPPSSREQFSDFLKQTDPKRFTPAQCTRKPNYPVSQAYIAYCEKTAPAAHPSCPVPESVSSAHLKGMPNLPYQGADGKPMPRGKYFEPLDCRWHIGPNPRKP